MNKKWLIFLLILIIFIFAGCLNEKTSEKQPIVFNPNPINKETEVSINISSVSVIIQDPDGDPFNWIITTLPNIGSASGNYSNNGTKTCNITNLKYDTTYYWYVQATDGKHLTSRTFFFSTQMTSLNGQLNNDINDGKSIMLIVPHPDDELFISGTLSIVGGDRGNKCYLVHVISADSINPDLGIQERKEAIDWLEKTYLTDYFTLNSSRPLNWDNIQTQLISVIETIKPDIIITFSPYGYYDQIDHIATSMSVTDLYGDLSYKPKLYWIINMDQDLPLKNHYEYELYPPTDIIDLDVNSTKLGTTFWGAKLEVWEHYAKSIPDLQNLLDNEERIQNNDRKEYFMRKF